MGLIEEVAALPQGWNFVLCHEGPDKTKAAYQSGWPKLRQDSATITELLKGPVDSRKASMVGVLLGDASGGLLAVDHDGESASALLRSKFNIQNFLRLR